MIRAGELNQRVTFKTGPGTDPITRLPTEGGEVVYSCWAAIEGLQGREYFAAAAIHEENNMRVTIRMKKGLDSTMNLYWNNQKFNIKSIFPDYLDNSFLTLMCTEVT
jgi:SPP1 family predicted phage head-tail adaptor